jgi:hypothetical protein
LVVDVLAARAASALRHFAIEALVGWGSLPRILPMEAATYELT